MDDEDDSVWDKPGYVKVCALVSAATQSRCALPM
jgi:hypothetical protein